MASVNGMYRPILQPKAHPPDWPESFTVLYQGQMRTIKASHAVIPCTADFEPDPKTLRLLEEWAASC